MPYKDKEMEKAKNKEWYQKNKDLVDLPMKYSSREKTLLEAWT